MKLGNFVVKHHKLILLISVILLIPAVLGMIGTRINYDMLSYLPSEMDTISGQETLKEQFKTGAFAFIVCEDMTDDEVAATRADVEEVAHVKTALWYDSLVDLSVPKEILPDKVLDAFESKDGKSTLMLVLFDTGTSDDETLQAVKDIRSVMNKHCFLAGLSAVTSDLKDLCEKEEPIYVAVAVVLALITMIVFLDGWLVPVVFLLSIGMAILYNLGTNYFLGEISYVTKALSAVLQLAVTMDYSIFLWHSYNEQREKYEDNNKAMAVAIKETFASVIGSSITTVAGFVALCFMTFLIGKDLGIVMAKGVILGVIGSVTILPSLVLALDKYLQKTKHKSILPDMNTVAKKLNKSFVVLIVIFLAITPVAYYGYEKSQAEVYYDFASALPQELDSAIANSKMRDDFNMSTMHILMLPSDMSQEDVKNLCNEVEDVKGINYVMGLESLIGTSIPEEVVPDDLLSVVKGDEWQLIIAASSNRPASDDGNAEVEKIKDIVKDYSKDAMVIGEGPCMADMISLMGTDFATVNIISIILVFIIIAFVEQSVLLPIILIAVIEISIFINLACAHFMGTNLIFIAPICVTTIQLGATVDYAILMTTRYKKERILGNDKKDAVRIALSTSIPSIIVSAMGLFMATFGVYVYSDIDIISSICLLLARGAIISMFAVILFLPALLILLDKPVCFLTRGMRDCIKNAGSKEV